jgi:hypothetical protein
MLDYLMIFGVFCILVVSVINLVITIKEKKEGYFSGGGPFGFTNSSAGGFGTKEGYFSGGGPFGTARSGNGAFDSGRF